LSLVCRDALALQLAGLKRQEALTVAADHQRAKNLEGFRSQAAF
jgi:hypothetical protein